MAAEPADRFASADELGRALDRFARRPYAILARTVGLVLLAVLGLWAARGRSWPGSAPPSTEPRGPVGDGAAREASTLRILGLSIQHLAKWGQDRAVRRGELGERSFAVRPDDDVTVRAELSEPAYAYLIAFRPDGVDEICDPEDAGTRPQKTQRPRYPPASKTGRVYRLVDGSGLQAFALVVSRRPLPSYCEWKREHGSPPWRGGLSSQPGVVWWHDGQWLLALTADDPTGGRGKDAPIRGGGSAVADLAAWLGAIPGIEAVAVKAFPVPPVESQ
jgi:hypothetical protein